MLRDMIIQDEKMIKELHMVAGNVVMTWSKEVLFEWRQVFNLTMRVMNPQELNQSIEKCLTMCEKTQPLVTRISGAYLLGKMVKHFKPNQIPIGWARKVTMMT